MKNTSNLDNKGDSYIPSGRRDFIKQTTMGGLGIGLLGTNASSDIFESDANIQSKFAPIPKIKITDIKCANMGGRGPLIRITTSEGINGYGQAKNIEKSHVLFYKDYLIGEDPTDVERCLMKIRRMGSFKPWGSAVSGIEMALWDIAGKAANVPVYKLLGGKIREQVRCYNGGVRFPMTGKAPEDYANDVAKQKSSKEGFTIIKEAIGFHGGMAEVVPNFSYSTTSLSASKKSAQHSSRGPLTERGMKHIISCVEAMKNVLGDEIGLALDCGPGYMLSDSIKLAKALEPFNLMWLEDMLTGDYTPYVMADVYKELTQSTSTPIHTGEQIYLRQNFRELIEHHAVRVLGPDPSDMGGIAELKWVTEYADLHGIQMAPHGIFNGLIGLAAQVHVGATLPENFIAFEYSLGIPEWWYEILEGLPDPIVKNGLIDVWDKPGLGVEINVKAARRYLTDEDKKFFD